MSDGVPWSPPAKTTCSAPVDGRVNDSNSGAAWKARGRLGDTGGMSVQSPSFPVPNAFALLCAQYAQRLPALLEDLTGPARGTVDLPLHVVWSGRRSYGLEQPRSRMSLYRTVLAEGQRQDLIDFLNRDLLIAQWPVLRTLISRPIRDVWESAFPELAAATAATAA